jgi:hypothetical protein
MEEYITGVVRIFYNSLADYFGGSSRTFYGKIFIKNNHATSALVGAEVHEKAEGIYELVTFGVENSFDTIQTIADRSTTPTGVVSYGAGPTQLVELPHLGPGVAQGIWLKLDTEPGDPPVNSYYGLRITGRAS